ncbi:tyrosine-type recombinase/integrase [Devosia sp. FKR38]|uniref:tyrosine-type recombinase/integrase n=1 Tax=Devosia sp. FKR38 TaxID=2562312 RepID=UPI0020BF5086|nr:tyrosine-type recombinase/integrase [Devosia sp. FKR38]
MARLTTWWGGKTLSEVTGVSCRAYADWRALEEDRRQREANVRRAGRGQRPLPPKTARGGARRDLEDLRAAINHHSKEGLHRGVVGVWLPERGQPRERWLTRSEAARLLWVCWRTREIQVRHRGTQKGRPLATTRYPLRHIARFVLIGLYTGTRAAAIASASPKKGDGKSYVDLDRGIFYRLAGGKRATNKRQPPVPLPPNLLSHMRRWGKPVLGGHPQEHFVVWNGKAVQSVKTGFGRAVELAGLSKDVTPHTLRHTAATWLMQNGVSIWEAAGYLGMSPEMVERTYGHHHPDHLKGASLGFRRNA